MERMAAMIRLPLMPPNFYYVLPFKDFMSGPNVHEKVVMKAGGELLERFNLSRDGMTRLLHYLDTREFIFLARVL